MQKLQEIIKRNTFLFALYFFSFLLVEQIINDNIYFKFGEEFVVIVYAISIFFTGLGYISLTVFNRTKIKPKTIRLVIEILFMLSMVLNLVLNGYICILCSILVTFSFGYIGAYVHWKISQSLSNESNSGKIIGIYIAISLIVQILFYNLIQNIYLLLSIILIASLILFKQLEKNEFSNKEIKQISDNNIKKDLEINKTDKMVSIITVTVISIIIGLQDGLITYIDSIGKINVYGIPRIFYIIGILIAGYITDKKNGKYLSIVTIFWVFISICGIVFFEKEKMYNISVALIFLLGGFYVMYLTIKFIKIAPYTKTPELWAGMGRIVRNIVTSIVVIPSEIILRLYGNEHLIIISIMFSTILLITLYKELNTIFAKEYKDSIEKIKNNMENEIEQKVKEKQLIDIENFINKYKFTQKEKEVCIFILKENKKTKEISENLYISERSVQRHLTSIYRKTNTSSRNELYNLFYKVEK